MEPSRVLFVDDDKILHFILQEQVSQLRVPVTLKLATNGIEALNYLSELVKTQEHNAFPKVILVDIHMPVMGGWEFLQNLSELFREQVSTSVVCLFSSCIEKDEVKLDEGRSIYGIPIRLIEKPLTQKLLEELIAESEGQSSVNLSSTKRWSRQTEAKA